MKKSKIVMLLCLLAAVPLTIFLGSRLPGRSYYLTSTLVLIEIMLPFFLAFEGESPRRGSWWWWRCCVPWPLPDAW